MNRRNFLQGAAPAPLIFGLRDLLAQDDAKPAWLDAAFKRMKDNGLPGLVLVAPSKAEERETFGETLGKLVEGANEDVRELLLETVVICLTPELAKKHAPPAEGNRILLSARGEKIAADIVAAETFGDAKKFVASFEPFVHGAKGEHLRATVTAIRESTKEASRRAIDEAIDRIDVDGPAPEDAQATLAGRADHIVPWLVLARMECVHKPGRAALRKIVLDIYARREQANRLPFGTTLVNEPGRDPCPKCGMGAVSKPGRRFLKILPE